MRLWRRTCPRCSGDVFEERHLDGVDLVCLQCGNILTTEQEAQLRSGRAVAIARDTGAATAVAA